MAKKQRPRKQPTMDSLIQALLQSGVIDAATAEILNRQISQEAARQWAEDVIFSATQSALSSQQERLLALLLDTEFDPSAAQLAAFWSGEDEALGRLWLPTVQGVASERATIAAVQAGQARTFDLVSENVLSWVNAHYTSTDAAAFGSLPNLNITARQRAFDAFREWQTGELGGRRDGLPQLIRALEQAFGPTRASAIAITETTRIFTQATRIAEEGNPFTVGFMWLTSDPCEICAPMNGQIRRKGEGYASGLDIPAHVRCKCSETQLTDILFEEERARLNR